MQSKPFSKGFVVSGLWFSIEKLKKCFKPRNLKILKVKLGQPHPALHTIFLLWVLHTRGYLVTKNGLKNRENSIGKREKRKRILDL